MNSVNTSAMPRYSTGWKPARASLLSKVGREEAITFVGGLSLIGAFVYVGAVFSSL